MMERLTERRKVIDILEKMSFFQGQRAGRELWLDKPVEVQEEDLENFNRDIRTIRDYICDLETSVKKYKDLEEQGLLLKLPCKVGTPIYYIVSTVNRETNEWEYYVQEFGFNIDMCDSLGKMCFLTKEEAEAKLEELKDDGFKKGI